MNFFGSRKKTPAATKKASNSPVEAIGKIKEHLRVMEKGTAHLEARIKKCHMDALKKSKAKNKRGALLDLKRKKLLEKQLTQKQAQSFNLENQLFALENANSNKQMLDTMKVATGAMSGVMNSVYVQSSLCFYNNSLFLAVVPLLFDTNKFCCYQSRNMTGMNFLFLFSSFRVFPILVVF